jgi:P27 family predicted phage terminase small subunit
MARKPPLQIVPTLYPSGPEPPRTLGDHGRALWDRVVAEYDIADVAGAEMLAQCCTSLDRAEALRAEIERDGPVIRVRGQIKDHPALKHELAARSFVCRTLTRLGLNFEPARTSSGRPPSS